MVDPEALVPRTAGALDPDRLRALPLAAVDRFVLSLVDGTTSVGDLAQAIDLGVEEVLASLLKLESLQVVVLPGPSKAEASRARRSMRPRAPSRLPPAETSPSAPEAPPPPSQRTSASTFTPETDIDLEPEHQRQIAELFGQLGTIDHYTLLGIPRTADKKAIKRAYFEATGRFHPDRFFRKRLGGAKLKMETVFARMTEAHDVLTSVQRRAEYDTYLGSVDKTRGLEHLLAEAFSEVKRAEEVVRDVAKASIAPPAVPPPPPSPEPTRIPTPARLPFDPPSSPKLGPVVTDPQTRRDMLARRLMGAARAAPPPKIAQVVQVKTEDAVDALKRRYEETLAQARGSQARKYAESGMASKAKGDAVAAANALRVALSFDPENAELKAAHEESQRAADLVLADQYLKQAEYEERSERWADAGRSWQRVVRARDSDAKPHERAALCLVKAGGDLHEAAALAQRAVQLQPKSAAYRVTLANVYLAAGLAKNAKRELEAAAQLAPDDANVAALLKRIAKPS